MNFADTQLLIISQITTRAHKRYLYVRRQVGVMYEREMWDCCGKGRLQLANSDGCDIPPPSTLPLLSSIGTLERYQNSCLRVGQYQNSIGA